MLPHMNLLGFLHTEKPKKNFFDQPNNQKPKTKKLNKSHFQGFVNSQYFFMKISWVGPWVSRIDWCKGHWFCSTHVAVRLADISSKMAWKHKKFIFCLFLSLRWPASRPYGLSKINALRINWSYSPKDQFVKVWWKLLSFWLWLKNSVFLLNSSKKLSRGL